MSYQVDLFTANPQFKAPDNSVVDITATIDGRVVRYTASATDAVPLSQELHARAVAGDFGLVAAYVPPEVVLTPDWRGFLDALRSTSVFAALRAQARLDVAANALATELRLALGEAALGSPDATTIQSLLDELLPTLTPEQAAEIQAGISAFNIPLTTE